MTLDSLVAFGTVAALIIGACFVWYVVFRDRESRIRRQLDAYEKELQAQVDARDAAIAEAEAALRRKAR
jgi:hypothetical protein